MNQLDAVLKRTLLLVAHPDDETVAFGALLRRITSPAVVFATDGAPRLEQFWNVWGSREKYKAVRQGEAGAALATAGVEDLHFIDRIPDQELYRNLDTAFEAVRPIAADHAPDAILTLAYEGGHPDHDACSVLAAALGANLRVQVWEAPLYHRLEGTFVTQEFLQQDGSGIRLELSAEDVRVKRAMIAAYVSQRETLEQFTTASELVRPQPRYNYARPPHPGELNYEAWGWSISPEEVCQSFARFIDSRMAGRSAA